MSTVQVKAECDSCSGTGLYSGMAEREGTAVVCHYCDGTGIKTVSYREPTGRKRRRGITTVFKKNVGIVLAQGAPGGLSYNDWWNGKPFPSGKGTEDREHTCPAWWYQNTDYKKKPNWDRCIACGSFSDCKYFKIKKDCWTKFDRGDKK